MESESPSSSTSKLDEEIETWKGFPWALRKDDLALWNAMIKDIRCQFGEAVEASGKDLTTDPFFMVLLLAQQKMIKRLEGELRSLGVEAPRTLLGLKSELTLDAFAPDPH